MGFLMLLLVFILILLCLLQFYLYHTDAAKLFSKIPGPYKLPIIGNLLEIFFNTPVQLFYLSRNYANDYKKLYSIQVAHHRVINVYNPEDAEIVLSSSKHITKSILYTFLHPWLNEGLLTSKGEKWQKRRKILTPAFHFNILKQFCKTFDEQSQILVDIIKSKESQTLDVGSVVTRFAMNSICETAMGTQLKKQDNSTFEKYTDAIHKMGFYLLNRVIKLWLQPEPFFKLSPTYSKQKDALKVLHSFTTSVIRQRRKERESGNGVEIIHNEDIENEEYFKSNKKRLAMLDLLLSAEAEGKIDESGIREEVDTFMFEGHDTTSMAICFGLMVLANNKDAQNKIVEELNEIFQDDRRPTTMEDLNKMKYLEMCVKEILRLYPSVPFISRRLEEDVEITDYSIPCGTTCHIHIFDLHRDPNIYQCPDEFIPERFTLENSSKRHPFAYVPFSAGPRNCIGQRFAMYELKSVFSTILRSFELEPVTKPKNVVFSADLILRSKDPIYVQFKSRI